MITWWWWGPSGAGAGGGGFASSVRQPSSPSSWICVFYVLFLTCMLDSFNSVCPNRWPPLHGTFLTPLLHYITLLYMYIKSYGQRKKAISAILDGVPSKQLLHNGQNLPAPFASNIKWVWHEGQILLFISYFVFFWSPIWNVWYIAQNDAAQQDIGWGQFDMTLNDIVGNSGFC